MSSRGGRSASSRAVCSLSSARASRGSDSRTPRLTRTRCAAAAAPPAASASGCGCVRAVGRIALSARLRGERCHVGTERGDLERRGRSGFELLLECEASARVVACGDLRVQEGDERLLPCSAVGVREVDGSLTDRVRLRKDASGVLPLGRTTGDHGDEPCRERHGQRGRRSAAGASPSAEMRSSSVPSESPR